MSNPNTTCKVCEKKYFCCSDSRKINSWRTMACSIGCYKEYMRRIEESRKPKPIEPIMKNTVEIEKEDVKTEPTAKIKFNKKKTFPEPTEETETSNLIEN